MLVQRAELVDNGNRHGLEWSSLNFDKDVCVELSLERWEF
ncbi:hypothetical protein HHE02_17130 [Helicobacter heilmannii]|uniref:Uncharacterized protein n=1 Tax=Helicobacter heilmannii TaxID=35817 RepID=A0A0K2XWX8_HELHE|nr:hypothetical protein BN341_6010 [Helicobacter heilmannii ASB1.4]CRF45842.1 hypothetical protein HHE014_08200 [Helicobacter heilmannii]CCM73422.1 hypothetical protein BN341_6050 [Helicobacter heilmannii ASB1.4]CCM73514.1 hypothetical protein BN341_9310 [Helicobacter heilmannii ASB1.4]CRF48388.1 hypothetical protein HHE02_17130 [Helicobacter heilmannii]